MNEPRTSYRERIYSVYASMVQGATGSFDSAAANGWGVAYAKYLDGWLPEDHDAAILDAACGGGRLLHLLRRAGYRRLAGVDMSPDQVALARQVVPDVSEENVLEYLDRKRDEFDLVLGLDILEHFTKNEVFRFLDGCHGALKIGGRLVLQTPNGESPWFGAVRHADFTHEVCFTPGSLKVILGLCGFSQIDLRECGPVPHGLRSAVRAGAWQVVRLARMASSLVETGSAGSRILTRVFLVSGRRS